MLVRCAASAVVLPLARPFAISRGVVNEITVVRVTLEANGARGRGEARPYARYSETPASVLAQIEAMRPRIEAGITRDELRETMKAGAARNALDCALLDLECKASGRRAHEILGLPAPRAFDTTWTVGLGTPEEMAAAAREGADRPLIKVKLGGDGGRDFEIERMRAVRAAAPNAALIVDPNEGWGRGELATRAGLQSLIDALAALGVKLIEQPLPASDDALLRAIDRRGLRICADESVHETKDLAALADRYDAVNVKCDKTGGITEAVALAREAKRLGFSLMVGCMLSSSLATAPATLLTPLADFIDLDGPVWLARDIEHGLVFRGASVEPPTPALWG